MKAGDRLRAGPGRARGFTYLGAVFLVMLLGLALAGAGQVWSVAGQRARERELLWVGTQYARAIDAYYQQSPGLRQYPQKLEDLVEDKRFPMPRRHLRRLYPDPVMRSSEWGLILTPDGRIAGVHSRSEARPFKQAGFPLRWEDFNDRQSHAEWRFVGEAGLLGSNGPPAGPAPGAPAALATRSLAVPLAPVVPVAPVAPAVRP